MGGITTIIAAFALITALAALWMVTEAVKKIDNRTRRVVDSQLKGIKSSFGELAKQVQKSNKTQEAIINRMRDLVKSREAANLDIADLKRQLDSLDAPSQPGNGNARRKA